ncbi:hypothetical protein CTAYLR_010557 [Chrysophaeum taylorii]|uniref:CHAT domain-containing protein n=1 Tax=Chrysophaeum taylorii TaxID=2483200 RepID=A0AAD7U6L8_9STRA|nr:hypothetical protein CTAYLR_010557 [Chrysophaeum taylorii]
MRSKRCGGAVVAALWAVSAGFAAPVGLSSPPRKRDGLGDVVEALKGDRGAASLRTRATNDRMVRRSLETTTTTTEGESESSSSSDDDEWRREEGYDMTLETQLAVLVGTLIAATCAIVMVMHCYFFAVRIWRGSAKRPIQYSELRVEDPSITSEKRAGVTVVVALGALGPERLGLEVGVIHEALRSSRVYDCQIVECQTEHLAKTLRSVVDGACDQRIWVHLAGHGSSMHTLREELLPRRGSEPDDDDESVRPGGAIINARVVADSIASLASLAAKHSRSKARLNRGSYLDLVFANSCHSASLAHALRVADVPTVVGWRSACADAGATRFAAAFYRALASGACPTDAFDAAKRALLVPVARGVSFRQEDLGDARYRGGDKVSDELAYNVVVVVSESGSGGSTSPNQPQQPTAAEDAEFFDSLDALDEEDEPHCASGAGDFGTFRETLAPKYAFLDPHDADAVDPATGRARVLRPDSPFVLVDDEPAPKPAVVAASAVDSKAKPLPTAVASPTAPGAHFVPPPSQPQPQHASNGGGNGGEEDPREIVAFLDRILDDDELGGGVQRPPHYLRHSSSYPPQQPLHGAGSFAHHYNYYGYHLPQHYHHHQHEVRRVTFPHPPPYVEEETKTPSSETHQARAPPTVKKNEDLSKVIVPQLALRSKRRRIDDDTGYMTSFDVIATRDFANAANANSIYAGPLVVGVPVVLSEDTDRFVKNPVSRKRHKPPTPLDARTIPYLGKSKVARLAKLGVLTVEDLARVDPEDRLFAVAATKNNRSDHAKRTLQKWRDKAIMYLLTNE